MLYGLFTRAYLGKDHTLLGREVSEPQRTATRSITCCNFLRASFFLRASSRLLELAILLLVRFTRRSLELKSTCDTRTSCLGSIAACTIEGRRSIARLATPISIAIVYSGAVGCGCVNGSSFRAVVQFRFRTEPCHQSVLV